MDPLQTRFEVDRRTTDAAAYFAQLTTSAAVCAYGGQFIPDFYRNPYLRSRWEQGGVQSYNFKRFDADVAVLRWDSWRYFESAVMACAPLHLDFEKYGFVLPVNPVPWVEYIPIDMATVSTLAERLADAVADDTDFLIKIGQGARAWALRHHAPVAQARTILDTVAAHWRTSAATLEAPVMELATPVAFEDVPTPASGTVAYG